MQNCEEGHLDAKKPRRNANVDVRVADLVGWFERSAGRCEERDDHLLNWLVKRSVNIDTMRTTKAYRLPKGEENHQFDANDLKRRPVFAQLLLQLDIELHQAKHSNRNTGTLKAHNPDMRKSGIERVFAIAPKHLCDHRNDGERHTHQTILENARPHNIKPSKTRPRLPEGSVVLATSALLHEEDAPEPVDRRQRAEEVLLLVQPGRHILAHEREETRNGESFIAVAQHLEVDGVPVVEDAEEGHRRVNWNHKQDADDVLLLAGHEVVRRVAVD